MDVETYDRSYLGRTTVAGATLASDNTVYARLTLDLGPGRVAALARTLGIDAPLPQVPSVGLGAGTVSPLDMATAYATLAAGGRRAEPLVIRKVVLADGSVDRRLGRPKRKQVLPAATPTR